MLTKWLIRWTPQPGKNSVNTVGGVNLYLGRWPWSWKRPITGYMGWDNNRLSFSVGVSFFGRVIGLGWNR